MKLAFDRVVITTAARVRRSLSVPQFYALPLTDRLRAIFEKRLEFYLGDERIETVVALQSLRQNGNPPDPA